MSQAAEQESAVSTAASGPPTSYDGLRLQGVTKSFGAFTAVDDLDLDVLADRVERAAWLIGVCRERIASTRLRVDELVADLNPEAPVA